MSRVIFSSIFVLNFTAKVFKKLCFLQNENCHVTRGVEGWVRASVTKYRGEGCLKKAKKGQKSVTYYLNGPLDYFINQQH